MSSDWNSVSLGECVEFDTGFQFKSAQYTESEAGVRLLRGDNIGQGSLRWEGAKRWIRKANDSLEVYELRQNDLVLAMDRPWIAAGLKFAKVRDNDLPALLVQRVARLRPKPHMDVDYLHSVISSPDFTLHIQNVTTGTAVPHISGRQIQDYKFALPDLGTQRSVGKFLMSLDDRITLLRETNDTLEAIAQALFKSWFVNFEPVRAKIEGREPEGMDETTAALFPDSFEESELGLVPMGWASVKFADFITRLPVGKKYDQKTASPNGATPILDQGKSGVVGYHDDEPGVVATAEDPVIVFANHTCYMRLIAFPFSAIQNVLPFRGKGVNTLWAYFATKDRVKFSEYKGHWPDFAIEKAILPNTELTDAFARIVAPLMNRVRQNEIQSETLADLRDTLLPRLISGQLRLLETESF